MPTSKLVPLKKEKLIAFTHLLQNPAITASCTENCGCNEACGCKKDHCCEAKCACDSKGKELAFNVDDLIKKPDFKEAIKSFDPARLKTIADFQSLVKELQQKIGGANN